MSMFNAGIVINLTLLLGRSSFSSSDSLSATSVSRAAGAASAVAICDAVHGTHNKSSKILHAHQRSYLCISTEWSTGTRESVLLSTSLIIRRQTRIIFIQSSPPTATASFYLDAGIIFYPQRFAHPYDWLRI